MACSTTTATAGLISPALTDAKPASRMQVGLPTLPPTLHVASPTRSQSRESWKTGAYYRSIARNIVTKASGGASAEVATELPDVATELPEVVKTIQEAWNKVEDKYAVTSLAVAGLIALWGSNGMISAIDRIPLVPGVFELVGIGYTGWFAYRNVIFKPDREALIAKIKSTYSDIIGTS